MNTKDFISILNHIKNEIYEESDFAYADFDRYKEEVLGVEVDELPDDDFRYGMERSVEIINKYLRKIKNNELKIMKWR